MRKPKCDYCHKELKEFGAILFSPPDHWGMVQKYHVCVNCFNRRKPRDKERKMYHNGF